MREEETGSDGHTKDRHVAISVLKHMLPMQSMLLLSCRQLSKVITKQGVRRRGRGGWGVGTDHRLVCQQVLSPLSVRAKATDHHRALHDPQLLMGSEDPQVAVGTKQGVQRSH